LLLLLLLLFLIGPSPVFYLICLFSCDVDIQLSHRCFGGHSGYLKMFGFPFFAIFASRLSFIHARLLILVRLMSSFVRQFIISDELVK